MTVVNGSALFGRRTFGALCGTLLGGCGSKIVEEKLAIAEYGKLTSTLPWAVAFRKGYLRENGLNVTDIISSGVGGGGLRNVLASNMGVGNVGTTAAIAAINQGIDLRIVMCNANHIGDLTWATRKDSGIHSMQDLAGRKVAFTAPRSTTEMVLRAAVAKAGLTGKVEIIAIGGLGPGLTALAHGAVDATPLVDPTLTLEPDKYRILFRGYDIFPKFTYSVVVATREFTEKYPDKLRAVLRARRRAVEFMEKNRDETALIYSQLFEFSLDVARKLLPKYYDWGQWSHGEFSREGLAAMSDGMMLVGQIDKPVDWSKAIDQSFLEPDQRGAPW
jgi:NitT/TauT family transport system substrate-binding protein